MKLTDKQIETLYAFTKKKFVHWYDLQTELVDHLAEKIEEETNANPKMSFEQSLEKVYAGFGVMGFSTIIQQKSAQLERQYRREVWKELKQLFYWPNIVKSLCILGIIWLMATTFPSWVLAVAFFAFEMIVLIKFLPQLWRYNKQEKKLMMLQVNPLGYFGFFFFQYPGIELTVRMLNTAFLKGTGLWFAVIFIFVAVITILATISVSKNIVEKARVQYPEVFVL